MEKNRLFAFIFAFCPGAGEMYMGMMKKGMVIMAGFWGLIAIASFMRMGFLSFLLPVIWFYSFFDTFNVAALPYERRVAIDAAFMSGVDTKFTSGTLEAFAKRRKNVLGWGGIIVGIWMLLEWVAFPIIRSLIEYMGYDPWIFNYGSIPNIMVAIVIIVLGVRLLKKKDSAPTAEDFVEFSGKPPMSVSANASAPVAEFSANASAPISGFSGMPSAPVADFSGMPSAPVAEFSANTPAPVAEFASMPSAPVAEFSGNPPEAL